MYLLKRDYPTAIEYYGDLAARFPGDKNASAAHWRSGWLSYRLGLYPDAERIFDEQIRLYPGATETVSALYWRGRLYETQDHNPAMAAANYRTIVRAYQHYFYAQMARQRLAALGNTQAASQPQLDRIQPVPLPHLVDTFPEDSPHLAKARLLANAGLNEYIAQEIKADPDSSSWSALAEAQIYSSYGETFRAVRAAQAGFAERGFGLHPVHSAGLLADSLSRAVVEHDPDRVGQEQSRSLPGGLAHPSGVGVRSERDLLRQRVRPHAVAPDVGRR